MKYLVAGLGNPGSEYESTRHNIGFKILDALVEPSNIFFEADRYANKAQIKHKGRTLVLIKPTTYMNLSGKAVRYWLEKEKISLERFLVITDDIALPFGKVRLRAKGSDGGHNGLKNISEVLGRQDFIRMKFGIGAEFSKGRQVDYVLGEWNETELLTLKERIQICADAVLSFTTAGLNRTMSDFNKR
ncbi:MAG: aminoacyl-tRNA hydrolase [Crocinitomicaceae bacterium]|nr:aminoacyl-tRNA hydrolase [Crocinitomicaceae bacterium]|tara:strand:+ start:10473 stop:11036 length:564 start_codon:yes stop_codon:yes gene_type:complete